MAQFMDGLFRLLFKFEVIPVKDNPYAVVIFAVGCATIGLLTVVADLAFFMLQGESLLKLKHNPRNTLMFGFAWALGALIIGYIGQVASIFQVSLVACATVGVTWPIVFTEIIEKLKKQEEIQEPTDEVKE